ncbi:RagB/SusD family nutrient uptake outer membrane protein [Aestuariibaculum lutulentum]|uniref:SusD/RagB family nutrient-binding outer membrane lipoprotein n=1 Tax=Aestuariibaculum lutulentum TaxID=2920935 RepID=A0ABS9RG76_9FLAO|nr:RagB/SusD family nutrient uptake outer membrane protein [Aestuariibaculum lutulentum]MCH4551946.1 SusD/RagB family nutrient-binding outer membrane lipoprotein [Aestuariibaculum lutulentum]
MKNIKSMLSCLVATGIISTSCSDLEQFNVNERNITQEQLEVDFQHVGSKYKPIFENIYQYTPAWSYQLQQNLNADVYSGYMTNPRPFVAGANNTTYSLVSGWNNFIWNVPYSNVMNNVDGITKLTEGEFPTLHAIALILKVEAMHRVSDVFGPIVYTSFGDLEKAGIYDSQETAYNAFFSDLDMAVENLMADIDSERFSAFDLAYDGDYSQWVKFANSLRLRLAIRISKVDPAKAKLEGEKALNQSLGVMSANTDGFFVNGSLDHPLATLDNAWADIRMNASMESFLVGYNDGRANAYFDAPTTVSGTVKGIRGGLPLFSKYADELAQKADYVGFSMINDNIHTSKVQLMTAAEVAFLKAEAALRGWSGAGDAQSNYETGIQLSFDQHGASGVNDYISDNASTPANYVDPITPSNNISALSTITIAWDEAASNEVKLEKIITQKWLAMFPEGQEAWSEFRRTGYPKIFPVVSNQSGGLIDTNIQIRRIPFVDSELSTNPEGVAEAVKLLSGPDNGGTRLWWDTGAANF